jgi:hypothetical protein
MKLIGEKTLFAHVQCFIAIIRIKNIRDSILECMNVVGGES